MCDIAEISGKLLKVDYALGGSRDDREEREALDRQFHGMIIGVGGTKVQELEVKSGARVSFEMEPFPCMVLRGTPEQRARAKQLAKQIVASVSEEKIVVDKAMWKMVIGIKGARIREMEYKSGARMMLREEDDGTPVLAAQGLPEARREALRLVNEVLERETTEMMPIEEKFLSVLIGKRGFTVKRMQVETGAYIKIERFPESCIVVKGTPMQREKALVLVERLMARLPSVLEELREDVQQTEGGIPGGEGEVHLLEQELDFGWQDGDPRWEQAIEGAIKEGMQEWKEERLKKTRLERGLLF